MEEFNELNVTEEQEEEIPELELEEISILTIN